MKTESDMTPEWRIEWHESVGSTNDLAKAHARNGESGGLAIIADQQTSGRGRMGRSWIAPPGSSLLVSLLLRPEVEGSERTEARDPAAPNPQRARLPADQAYLLTMLAAVSLCEAIEELLPIQAALKWPNDVLLSGPDGQYRKTAGILAEVDIREGMVAWVVLGFGVNISWHPSGVVDGRDLGHYATSLAEASHRAQHVGRVELLQALLRRVTAWDAALGADGATLLFTTWRNRLVTLGQPVVVRLPDRTVEGVAEGVEPGGALRIRDTTGQVQIVTTGEVEA